VSELRYERRGDAGWITLDRPDKRNALTPTSVRGLAECLDRAEHDRAVRSIVITGAGPAFCAGADLGYFRSLVEQDDGCDRFLTELLRPFAGFLGRLRASDLPVIAAVNGACAAGGLELVVCCDLVVAASDATFCDAHSRRGIMPAVGGAAGLVHAMGAQRASELLMLSGVHDAATMKAFGLVNRVVAGDDLVPQVEAITAELAERSPRSLALAKRLVQRAQQPSWSEHVEADLADFRAGWGSPDMSEGLAAYVERRPAVFGR
jgi:enoyl-CoA hydratase/carnithine racemase